MLNDFLRYMVKKICNEKCILGIAYQLLEY